MVRTFFVAGLLCISPIPALAENLLHEVQTLPFKQVSNSVLPAAAQLDMHSMLFVKGFNHDNEVRIVILRFDDKHSKDYHSRLNIEHPVPPGPFEFQLPLLGLKTPDKRTFDWASWRKFYLFGDSFEQRIELERVQIDNAIAFSKNSFGFDLGTEDSPVMTGMRKVTPDFPGLSGRYLRARHFASGSAMTEDGIEGIEQLNLQIPNGRWQIILWHRMRGEWENLPRQMQRDIRVQGTQVYQRKLSARQWIAQDYLQGQDLEAEFDGNLWQLHGERAFERVETEVSVSDGILRIQMLGGTTHDNYLAAVFVTPVSMKGEDIARLEQAMGQQFQQQWPLVLPKAPTLEQADEQVLLRRVQFQPSWSQEQSRITDTSDVVLTQQGFSVVDFELTTKAELLNFSVALAFYDSNGNTVQMPVAIRQGFWRYQRPLGASTLLTLDADELRSVEPGNEVRVSRMLPRRLNLVIYRPEGFSDGAISAVLSVLQGSEAVRATQFQVVLSDIKLPELNQSVGIYHEKAVHWGWFDEYKAYQNTILNCDYRLLKSLGLTALSPPLTTPTAGDDGHTEYVEDLGLYHHYFAKTALDYTTTKRLLQRLEPQALLPQLASLRRELVEQKLPLPHFAMVDEVNQLNPEQLAQFSAKVASVRHALPNAKVVGQLNKPQNRQLLGILDGVLINHGFGVERKAIARMQQQAKNVWLYNMPRPRLAAGFYLWRSGAQGYLQWHGRMPTGEPYYPLDGREADFQMIYPSLKVCPDVADINARLLALAEGILDLRWLNWLKRQAKTSKKARRLLTQITAQISPKWREASQLSSAKLHQLRDAIIDLALELHETKGGRHVTR